MLRDSRRRSPESSRRRRAERRHSREQLAATAGPSSAYIPGPQAPQYTAMIPQHQPSNVSLRSRADSSTSNTSSTSSSLLNISRKPRGFGIRSFFTSSAKSHSSKKKKRRAFRSKNSSSSSVDSDLAYGRGYIPKSTVNSPRHAPAHPSYRDTSAPVLGPDGRPALRRAQTDEEILELGRKLSLYARAENDKDLIRAGRSRPSQIAAGVAAISRLSRHDTSDSQGARGIGSSKPGRRHDSDDSDWESASDDDGSSSTDDYDAGLAYGSAQFSNTHLPETILPTHTAAPTIISQPPPEEIRPPNRKASAVDPAMFGPVNSLRGYINTPCGFRPGEYQRPQALTYDPHAPVPQTSSASIEANRSSQQPMRMVYPVPTSDPGRFETTGSVISGYTQHPHESPVNVSRPAPVPIQAPKPIVPVSTRVLEARRIEEDRYREREREERRKSERKADGGPGLAEAAVAGVAAAAIGGAVLSSSRDKREREKETARRAEEDRDTARRREREARRLDEERELARRREKEARRVVEEREKEARRLSEERALADREFEKRRQRDGKDEGRRDDKKTEEKEKDRKRRDSIKSNALVVDERVAEAKRKEERRRERREKQRKELEEIQAEIERQKALLAKEGKEIPVLAPSEPPPSRKSRHKEPREVERSTAPVDPFQFQVEDDAFPTPQFTTPARPLTPAVMTVEREPKWDDDPEPPERKSPPKRMSPPERMSRKDSYEQEQTQIRAVVDETEHSTIPAHPEVIAAVIASANNKERRRTREAEPTRDPIEEANRWYRLQKEIEREEESRSRSPEPSVLERYKDEGDDPVVRIVTPPAMDHKDHPEKSKYDGPNADVRIDHVITPQELHMFRVPPTSLDPNRGSPPKWKSRDPSCERERPLLNLVRPTPEPSPMPEKQEQRGRVTSRSEPTEDKPDRSERSRSRSRSRSPSPSVVLGPRGEVRQAPPDTPTSKSVTWGENDTKHYNPSSPDRTAEEREAAEKLRSVLGNKKKTGGGWGDLAAAFAAAAASGTLPGMSSGSTPKEQTKKETKPAAEKEHSPPPARRVEPERPSVVTSSPPSSRSIVDDHEQPPQPGPKPPSPSHHTSQKQMPGAFADDLEFTATLAAGLQSSGFDPNIVIDDPTYQRRDLPPGSNVSNGSSKTQERHVSPPSSNKLPYQRPFAETVTDLGIIDEPIAHTKPRERGFVVGEVDTPASQKEAPVDDEWDPTSKSKKNGKKSKRNTIDLVDTEPIVKDEPASEPDFEPKLSKKEQKKRDKAARVRDFDDESSTAREPDVAVAEPREEEWAPKLSKKEQKKRDRAARDEGSSTPRETEVESVADEWKEEKGKKGKKRDKTNRQEDVDDGSFTPRELEREPVVDVPEDDWADAKAGKKDKKKRDRAAREEAPSTPREVEYEKAVPEPGDEEWADAKSNKKDKKKRDKADRDEESFTSGVLVSEPASVGNDEWAEPKSSKKDKKGKKNRKSGSAWDDVEEATPSDDRSVSVPVDAFSDLQRTAAPAQDDEWDTPSKKSKKKSKRDSTYDTYDSPSRSVAPSEVSVASSSKKDKKSKRDSTYDTYDSPNRSVAPSEVSVESASKKDKKSRRKSTKDGYDRPDEGEPPDKRRDSFKPIDRDVSSLVSEPTRYDDRRESRYNGSWADEVEEAQSVVSAPPSSDRKDRKKKSSKDSKDSKDEKSSKEEKRSSGGFFGLFKGTNGGGSETQKDSDNKQSFLGNAGILGAGAGLAGAALASALVGSGAEEEEDARLKATRGTSGKEDHTSPTTSAVEPERSVTPPGRTRSISLGSQHVDPEIVQRVIKPAIDPQYGDLLPLPPSVPGSPNRDLDMEIENELPALPESRPDTPPAQQQQERTSLSTTKTHVRRRSAFETPTKSPSQTAIPIHFRLGQRSVPPSPGMARSSPIHSPSTPTPEIGSVPKPRSRPNSWGRQMLGEPKPLYLVEKASSGSMSTDYEDQQYPALPPSEPASSRESPAPESERRERDVDYLSLAPHTEMSGHERGQALLRLDTALAALDQSEPLESAELTPKAEKAPGVAELSLETRRESVDGSQSMDDSFHSATQSPVYRMDSLGLATDDVELPHEFPITPDVQELLPNVQERSLEMHTPGRTSPTVGGRHDQLDDFTELPPLPASSGTSLVDEPLPSRDPESLELAPEEVRSAENEPTAVEPMTKDRSSYLLHQTPPSAKAPGSTGVPDRSPSPSPTRKHGDKSGSDLDIAAGVAAGLFGSGVVASLMHEDRSSADHTLASGKTEAADDRLETAAGDRTVSPSKPDSPSGSIKSAEDLLTPDEFSFIPTKKGKKGKKGRKGQTRENAAESEPSVEREFPAEHQSVPEQTLTSGKKPADEAAPVEETSETPGPEEFSTPLPIPSSIPTTQDQDDGFFESASSKKSKKKQKKALARNILVDDTPVVEEPVAAKDHPEVAAAPLERSVSVSSKKGKKKKGKQAFVWEPEDAADDSALTPAEESSVVAAKDGEPLELPTADKEIGLASQIQLPASPETSRPTSPVLLDEPVEAPPAPLESSPDATTADTAPLDHRAQSTAQESDVRGPVPGEPLSLSQEQTLVADPASQPRDLEPTLAEADAQTKHKPEPEADAESEWASLPAKKVKKSKKDKKGKRTQFWEVEEPPKDDSPGAFPETPALEVKEPEGSAEASFAEDSLPGTFPETPAVEVQESEIALEDSLSADPLPGGFPETPAVEGTEPALAAPDVPPIPSQEETLVDKEDPVLPAEDKTNAEPEPEAEPWQPTPKKGKKGKKGKKQALMWEPEELPKDDAPSGYLSEPQTHGITPADSSTEVKDRDLHTGDLPTCFINEDVPADIAQAVATPEVEEPSTPTITKKGKKGKKAKKTNFVWEPEESAAEEPSTASTTLEPPSASEMPPVVMPPSLSSQSTVSEQVITPDQAASPEQHMESGPPTVSEHAASSKESAPADALPVLEQTISPLTPVKISEQAIRPATPPKVSEQTMVSQVSDLDDAINTPLPNEASGDETLDSEKNGTASAAPATSDHQLSPSGQYEDEEQSTATRSPTADPSGEPSATKGLVTSALSILPSVATVGSLFGLRKSKEKEHEAVTKSGGHTPLRDNGTPADNELAAAALNTPDETCELGSVDAVGLPLGEPSQQGPNAGGPTADMQSITPASESAQATHEVANTATVLVPDQQASPQEYAPKSIDVQGTRSEEGYLSDNQTERLDAPSSQATLHHEATPVNTDNQHPNIDEAQPSEAMDWELETGSGKMKSKKDKKRRAKAQSDTPLEVTEPLSINQVPSDESSSQHADRELQSIGDDLQDKAVDSPSDVKDGSHAEAPAEAPAEATPDDEWAFNPKKGKKGKKNRQKSLPVFENPDPETGGESSALIPDESQATDIPNITQEDTTAFGQASKSAKDITGADAPVEPSAEDLWAEPTGKKGKKGKKNRQKAQSAFDVLDREPSGALTPLDSAEGNQTLVAPAESEEQSGSSGVEASKEPVAGVPEEPTPEEPTPDDFWAETSGKKGKKDKKNKKKTARDWDFEPPPASEETQDVEPDADASKPEAQEPNQPVESSAAAGQDNLEATADDLWGFTAAKKGKKGKKDKKKGSSKTSSGITTPTVEGAPGVEETAAVDGNLASVGTAALDEPSVAESIPAVEPTPAEEPVAISETLPAETRLVQECQVIEGSPAGHQHDDSDEPLAEQTPAFEELPASETTDTVVDTSAHDKALTAKETSLVEETPNAEQHPASIPQEHSTLERASVVEEPGAIEQPPVVDAPPAATEASTLDGTTETQLPKDTAQLAITKERSLTEEINITPVTLDEIHGQQPVEPSSDDIWEESTKRGKKDKKGKKKRQSIKDSDAELPLTESATVSEPVGAAEQLTEALPEADQTEVAAAIARLTGDLREGGQTEDPDIGIAGVSQRKAVEKEPVASPAEDLWEQSASGKKGKKGKKNKQASKSFDFELPDTAESSQSEIPHVTYDDTSLDKLDKEPAEAAAEDIWEDTSGKKGKKNNKKKGKLSRQDTFEEPSQLEPTEQIDETQTPDRLRESQAELQTTVAPSEGDGVTAQKEVEGDDLWAQASTKKPKKGKKKDKAQPFSWDEPSQGQTEEPQVLDTVSATAGEAAPEVRDEEPEAAVSTSPQQLPSDVLADQPLASVPVVTEESSMPQADTEQGVEDSFWSTTKKKGKGKKRSKVLDLSQPELGPEDTKDSHGPEIPTPGDTSVAPSADESGPSVKGKKGKDKRRVSWALPAEETLGGETDADLASGEVTEAPVLPAVSDESQAASSTPAAHPASGEELEMSKELPHLGHQGHCHKSSEPGAATELSDEAVHDSAPPSDPIDNQPSGTQDVDNMPVLLSETAASAAITQLDQPSAEEAVPHETSEDKHTPETIADISTLTRVSESKDIGAEQHPRDEPSQVPQPFEEDLSALLPTSPYSVSLRKSKKDKKRRQSSLTDSSETTSPAEDDKGQAGMPDPTAFLPAVTAPEAPSEEPLSSSLTSDPDLVSREVKPIEDELELPQSFTLKRSKKDKKKGKAKTMPWDDVESNLDNSPSESWSTPPVPATQLSTIMEASTEDLPGSVIGTKRLQDVIVAEHQPEDPIDGQQLAKSTPDSQTADVPRDFESDASQRADKAATPTTQDSPLPVETPAESEDLSCLTKKDKKGKKGKKSQPVQPEPSPLEESDSPVQQDTTLRSAEDPHPAEIKEDDFVTPSSSKKGKKAKKNKRSTLTWDELEPTAETEPPGEEPLAEKQLTSEDVMHEPLADTQPEAVEDLPTEPQPAKPEPEHVRELSTSDTQEFPEAKLDEAKALDSPEGKPQDVAEQPTEPEPASFQEPTEAEDEWAIPVKKSKKGKKGKSAKFTDSNTPSGASTPLVEDAPVEVSEPLSSRDIGTVATTDDIKKSDALVEVPEPSSPRNIGTGAPSDDVKESAAPREPAWSEPSQQEVQGQDIWAPPSSKKSKKDKKKKGSKASDSEPPSGAQTPASEENDFPADKPTAEVQEPAEATIVSEEPATMAEAQEAQSEDIWESQSIKKSKKDKKRKGSKLTEVELPSETPAPTPVEQPVSREVEDLPLAGTAEPADYDVQPSGTVEPEHEVTAEPEPEDLWAVTGKKSKKDKKRKGSKFADTTSTSGTTTPSTQEESSARELDTSAAADIEPSAQVDVQQEADIEADDSWATPSKKSKKDKKGKVKQAAAGLLAGAAALSALPDVAESPADQKEKEAGPSRELVEAAEKEVEPDSFWETPTKKSKKDKKGKKSSSRSDSGTATPARDDEVVLSSDRMVDDAEVEDTSEVKKIPDVKETPESKEAPAETIPEQDDFPEFSTKKSRKDKKKKKGKQVDLADSGTTSDTQENLTTEAHVQKAAEPDPPQKDKNYFQAESQTLSDEEPSSKIEINPAVLGALRLSPDHGLKALLPSVETSGFVEPHVLYPIDTASPKLLTGSPPPKELLGAPPEAAREVDLTPSQESSRVSHSPPFDDASQRKRAKTLEVDQSTSGETVNPAREIAASYLEEKSQDPNEDEPKDDIKLSGQEPSASVASKTTSMEESRDIAASYLADKSTEAPPEIPLTEEPMVIDAEPEPSARDIAAAVVEVGPKTLLNTEVKPAVEDLEVPTSKVQDPPSPEARRLAASWLEHEHEQHHHESPAQEDQDRTGAGSKERDIPKDEPTKSASSLTSSSDHVRQGKGIPSNKKAKRRSTQEDDGADTEAAAAAGALAGGVTLLAEKFGGSKKKKGKQKKQLDRRTPRDDDLFDDPALWEGADRRPLEGSRMDENADGFWDVPDAAEEAEKRDLDLDEKAEMKDKDVVMGGTGEKGALRLREVMEEAAGDYIESPTLGRRASERKRDAERRSKARQEDDTAEIKPVQRAFSFPDDIAHEDVSTPVTAAPVQQRELVEDNIDDYSPVSRSVHHMSSIPDFRRSVPSLPPVQEEAAEEAEPEKHHTRHLTRTPEVNRDSGFLSDSPASHRRSHRFDDDGHRDSGVHLKDWSENTPSRLSESRGLEAHPARTSGSSLKAETRAYEQHGTPDRHRLVKTSPEPSRATPSRALGQTPKLREPSPPPRTPEPQKTLAKKRTTRQLDKEPAPERNVGTALTPMATERRVVSDNSALRQYSRSPAETSAMVARRSASNTSITRHRTPEPLNLRPDTPGSMRSLHSATPPLRRVDKRVSGDLRSVSLSQRSVSDLSANNTDGDKDKQNKEAAAATAAAALGVAGAAALALAATNSRASQNTTPIANEGRVRTKDMADVYDGYGEGRIGSPRSPTRPHSMRRRQSMQVLDLENKVKELEAENMELSRARSQVEQTATQRASMALVQRDAEIDTLKQNIAFLQKEVDRLAEVNEGLGSANAQIAVTHTERYRRLESQHAEAARELERTRTAQHTQLQQKDAEIAALRAQLEEAKDQIRHMQEQILASASPGSSGAPDFLRVRDVDYFDHRCQQLCSHVQQWVLRFSKFSDMRACRLTSEINDEKIIDRLDNAVLDGSDVDTYLADRVRRRDIFMSMTMTMVWEFVFTRYLFGMDREQRQKLKSLEKQLLEVGPPHAVRQWRAITLTLLASRPQFRAQRDADTEAVVQAVFQTLCVILPPPTNMEDQIQNQLRKVMREAVDLAVEMRSQRAEYMMLPPLQPEYDDTGELTETVSFNASLMNERGGGDDSTSNEEWEAAGAVVRVVLFPLVVKKGDDEGKGDDEVVVSPAQVLVARPRASAEGKRSIRMVTPSSDAGGASLFARSVAGTSPAGTVLGHGRNGSNVSMGGTEGGEGEFI